MLIEFFLLAIVCYYIFIKHLTKPRGYPPGPYRLPIIGNLHQLGEFPQIELVKMGKTYGPIISVKFGSMETIVINDYKIMKEAFNYTPFNARPNWAHFLARSNGKRRGYITTEQKEFAEQQKVTLRTLKDFGMGRPSVEPLIVAGINEVIENIKSYSGAPILLEILFNAASLNTLMVIFFGTRMYLKDPEFLKNIKHVDGIFPDKKSIQALSIIMPWMLKISKKYTGFDETVAGFKSIETFIRKQVDSHIQTRIPDEPRDFVDVYLDKIEKAEESSTFYGDLGIENLVYTIFDFIIGGNESSKTGMNWVCVTLATFPEIQEKIYQELISVSENSCPTLGDHKEGSLPYTEAFLHEISRFNTLAPLGFPKRSTEDTEFHGYHIKAGTNIVQNIYAAHMDKAVWGDPENFRPERFINDEGKVIRSEALLPFGSGRRICPGEQLSKDTTLIFVANLVYNFKIIPDCENPVKPNLTFTNTLFTTVPTYPRVSFIERNKT